MSLFLVVVSVIVGYGRKTMCVWIHKNYEFLFFYAVINFILLISWSLCLLIYKKRNSSNNFSLWELGWRKYFCIKALRRALEILPVINENTGSWKYLQFGKRGKRWGATWILKVIWKAHNWQQSVTLCVRFSPGSSRPKHGQVSSWEHFQPWVK